MISLFWKHIAPRLTLCCGLLTCLSILSAVAQGQAQVATRTQVSVQKSDGVLSFTAKVADAGGAPVSEGSVSFETAKGSLGSVFVKDGSATLNVNNPPQWAKTVTAVYHGDAAFAGSAASAGVSADSSGLPGFTVTASSVVVVADTGPIRNREPDGDFAKRFFGAGEPIVLGCAPRLELQFQPGCGHAASERIEHQRDADHDDGGVGCRRE